MNDYLDRDGSRTPIEFQCGLGLPSTIDAQVVQAATKWKRWPSSSSSAASGEGVFTDMRAVRKDYFLDHDHSCYVDQWDWEKVINPADRNLDYLKDTVTRLWKVIKGAQDHVFKEFPALKDDPRYPELPDELTFLHAEEILDRFPDKPASSARPPSCRTTPRSSSSASAGPSRTATRTRCGPPTTTTGCTETVEQNGQDDARAQRRHPRVEPRHPAPPRAHLHGRPRHQGHPQPAARDDRPDSTCSRCRTTRRSSNDEIPLSIGGGIGQSRTYMYCCSARPTSAR
jgi:aspartate--ammonia ligase